jgi:hypothetical protein
MPEVFRLCSTRTCSNPLALMSAVYPELKRAEALIRAGNYVELAKEPPSVHAKIYPIQNCLINWKSYNLDQIVMSEPSAVPNRPENEDLRCSTCFKIQTFRSANKRGNPKNVDMAYQSDALDFRSACCGGIIVGTNMSTPVTSYNVLTSMKQTYGPCVNCGQMIFYEMIPLRIGNYKCGCLFRRGKSINK